MKKEEVTGLLKQLENDIKSGVINPSSFDDVKDCLNRLIPILQEEKIKKVLILLGDQNKHVERYFAEKFENFQDLPDEEIGKVMVFHTKFFQKRMMSFMEYMYTYHEVLPAFIERYELFSLMEMWFNKKFPGHRLDMDEILTNLCEYIEYNNHDVQDGNITKVDLNDVYTTYVEEKELNR